MPLIRNTTPTAEPHAPDERKPAELLATGSDEERWIAARNAAETPEALSLLTRALSVERVPRVREAMFTALAKIATPESASVALPYLRSEDASLRTQALDALRAMPASAAASPTTTLLCSNLSGWRSKMSSPPTWCFVAPRSPEQERS